MKVKKESEKAGLKLNIQNAKSMASGPITSWQIYGEQRKTLTGKQWCKELTDVKNHLMRRTDSLEKALILGKI